jgi:aminoglycoside phosphotransferase family enzyme/predicted kinase
MVLPDDAVASEAEALGGADPAARASVVETHMSVLYFFGDRVLKVRRPVAYPFADFTRLAQRHADCEREVRLNSRLAPDVYLGTVQLSLGDVPIEYGVLMRRLPAERNLERLVGTGDDVGPELRSVAATLAAFHERAERSSRIDASATAAAMWQRWQSTEEAMGRFVGELVSRRRYREMCRAARRFLDGRRDLFESRIEQGFVCDGHGDIQASDVFCLPDGPRLIDCLEFDDELRFGDVLADAAFLAEDLERLGAPGLAATFMEEYRRRAGGEHPEALQHFYVAARAHVRMLVTCLRLEQGLATDRTEPDRQLSLALAHLRAALPRMILVGGPPGSGKSTLARWLGPRLGADVLSTDALRAEHAGRKRPGAAPQPVGEGCYTDAARAAVYDEMLTRAAHSLRMGRSVVLEATWQSAALRDRAAHVAARAAADVAELRLDSPAADRHARVTGRLELGADDSRATATVAAVLAAAEDPWPTAVLVDSSGTPEQTRRSAVRLLGTRRH